MNDRRDKILRIVSFVIFLLINGYLVLVHEPWRDEIHAWLMAKNMSIPEMIAFSRYEGHPLLWHFMLIPFARMGAPIVTMNIISYLIVAVSAFIFLFRTKIHTAAKVAVLFTIPFVYTYSSIARNYCLILLLGMIIASMYEKRYDRPFLYSIPIALMVFTHVMAWGFVAGATITFHIIEIAKKMLGKSRLSRRTIVSMSCGLAIIAASTIFAVLTLYGSTTPIIHADANPYTSGVIISMAVMMILVIAYTAYRKGKTWKEALTYCLTSMFIIYIYTMVYSSVLFQRLIMIQVFLLIFVLTVHEDKAESKKPNAISIIVYLLSFFITGGIVDTFYYVASDITDNYSSGHEMAEYINKNLPDEKVILTDAAIFAQTMVPYTDKEIYDIRYEANVEDVLYCTNESEKIIQAVYDIPNHEEYRGKYLILYYAMEDAPFKEIYRTSGSVTGEDYTLYYIP